MPNELPGLQASLALALQALDRLDIPWAITGSIAMAAHGHLRYTHDADVKILVGRLDDYEETLRMEMHRRGYSRIDEHTFEGTQGVIMEFYPVSGTLDRQTFRRRIKKDVLPEYGAPVWLVTPEDLILLKVREYRRWGSAIQIEDVRMLITTDRATLDLDYIEKQIQSHGLEKEWQKVVK